MLTINLKSRFRNKTFILAMVGAIVLLIQQLGFKDIIPSNYADIVNSILTILTMVGIVVDTSTKGISDQVVSTTTVQAVNSAEEVKTEGGTTSINNTVTENSQSGSADASSSSSDREAETKSSVDNSSNVQVSTNTVDNSASSKVIVDNPDNEISIGATVNSTSAVAPN
jgi:phi LC3 family holin